MNSTSKKIVVIAIIVILIAGLLWSIIGLPISPAPTANQSNNQGVSGQNNNVQQPQDSSDASLDQELSQMDSQMQDLNSDASNVDQGLNDQPLTIPTN